MKLPADQDKKRFIFGCLFLLANKLQTFGDTFFDDITTKQWFILVVLTLFPDSSPTLSELSQAAGTSHQNVKQIVNKLESKGFIELTKDKNDARKFRIKMTPKCELYFNQYEEKSNQFLQHLFQQLGDQDLETTAQVLNRLQENLEEMENEYVESYEK